MKKIKTLMDSFESLGDDLTEIEVTLLERYIDDLKESLPTPTIVEKRPSAPKVTVKPIIEETIKTEVKAEIPAEPETPIVEEISSESIAVETEVLSSHENHVTDQESQTIDNIDEELFQQIEIKDLSQKLSLKTVTDIDKALSINEKILAKNDLFDGNGDLMKSTIEKLNSMADYKQAVEFLKKGVARDFDWGNDKKKSKATHFLQVVQRRYL